MDTLPTSQSSKKPASPPPGSAPSGSMAKETGSHITYNESATLREIGQETVLPPEVSQAGVSVHPAAVQLPKLVQQFGVTPVGPAAPMPASTVAAIPLPLTDDQIAQGLHQSIMSSWRWLAEWCMKQLKQAHGVMKAVHGKIRKTTA